MNGHFYMCVEGMVIREAIVSNLSQKNRTGIFLNSGRSIAEVSIFFNPIV
jgi:hypothetical protein